MPILSCSCEIKLGWGPENRVFALSSRLPSLLQVFSLKRLPVVLCLFPSLLSGANLGPQPCRQAAVKRIAMYDDFPQSSPQRPGHLLLGLWDLPDFLPILTSWASYGVRQHPNSMHRRNLQTSAPPFHGSICSKYSPPTARAETVLFLSNRGTFRNVLLSWAPLWRSPT